MVMLWILTWRSSVALTWTEEHGRMVRVSSYNWSFALSSLTLGSPTSIHAKEKNGGWNGLAIAIIKKFVDTRSNPILEGECPGYSSVEIQIPCSDIYLLTCMVKNKITRIGGCQVDAEIDVFTIKYEYTRCTG